MNLVNLEKKGNLKLTVLEPKGNNDTSNLFRNSMKKKIWIKNRPSGLKLGLMGTFCRNGPFALIDHVINFRWTRKQFAFEKF